MASESPRVHAVKEMMSSAATPLDLSSTRVLSNLLGLTQVGTPCVAFIRHAAREELTGDNEQRDAEPINAQGVADAVCWSKQIAAAGAAAAAPVSGLLANRCVWLGGLRTEQTARAVASAWSRVEVTPLRGMPTLRIGGDRYETYKEIHGWDETMRQWVSGELPNGLLLSTSETTAAIASAIRCSRAVPIAGTALIVVTHDMFIFPLLTCLHERPTTVVPFLGGIVVPWQTLQTFSTALEEGQ